MSSAERQLTRHIIDEREARIKAVGELWGRLGELEREVRSARAAQAPLPVAESAPREVVEVDRLPEACCTVWGAPSKSIAGIDAFLETATELETLKAELASQRGALSAQSAGFDQSLGALRSMLRELEAEVREGRAEGRDGLAALGGRVDEELQALRHSREGAPGAARASEKALQAAPAGPWAGATELKLAQGGPAAAQRHEETLAALRQQVGSLEAAQQQMLKELSALRTVVVEMHINMPLHAVKASRIALRSSELSREERKVAISSLEAREEQLQSDIRRVRNSGHQGITSVLSTLGSNSLDVGI